MPDYYLKGAGLTGSGKGAHSGWVVLDSVRARMAKGDSDRLAEFPDERFNDAISAIARKSRGITLECRGANAIALGRARFEKARNMTIEFTKRDSGAAYLRLELEGAAVTSWQSAGNAGMDTGSGELTFSKISVTVIAAPDPPAWREFHIVVNPPKSK